MASRKSPKKLNEEQIISAEIDQRLTESRYSEELKVKILFLGTKESGKTTFLKQIRGKYGLPWSDEERQRFRVVIRSNCLIAIRELVAYLRSQPDLEQQLATTVEDSTLLAQEDSGCSEKQAYDLLVSQLLGNTIVVAPSNSAVRSKVHKGEEWDPSSEESDKNDELLLQLWKPMHILWNSKVMKKIWSQRRASLNVIDGHEYFLHEIARIASFDFQPTRVDIQMAYERTRKIETELIRMNDIDFALHELGAKLSGKHQLWINYFDHVDAVIFVVALSDYDLFTPGKNPKNRMEEALELFRLVCNSPVFSKPTILLFLNKRDIFAEKILESDIADQIPFSDYAGPPRDFNSDVLYFIQKFKDCIPDDDFNDAFIHIACATDINNVTLLMDSTTSIIMTVNLCTLYYPG